MESDPNPARLDGEDGRAAFGADPEETQALFEAELSAVADDPEEARALAGAALPHPIVELNLAALFVQNPRPDWMPLVMEHGGNLAPSVHIPNDYSKIHTERRKRNQGKKGMKYRKRRRISVRFVCEWGIRPAYGP
jgi:hypothetical protein